MSSYFITVIYAHHTEEEEEERIPFPEQTIPSEQLQLLCVYEDDIRYPHLQSLRAAAQAEGKYTIFLDEKDKFPEDLLERLSSSLESSSDSALAITSQVRKGYRSGLRYFLLSGPDGSPVEEDISVDIRMDPCIFPIEVNGVMVRTEILRQLLPECLNSVEPEKLLLYQILQAAPVFPYLGSVRLSYAHPREIDFANDLRCFLHSWYQEPFTAFLLPLLEETKDENGNAPLLLQRLTQYMIHCRINANTDNRNKRVVAPEEVAPLIDLFSDALAFTEIRTILTNTCAAAKSTITTRLFEIHMKKRDFSYRPTLECQDGELILTCDGELFGRKENLAVRLNLIDYKNGCLEIDGAMRDFFSPDQLSVYACMDQERYPIVYNQRYSMTKCFGVTYSRMKTFHVSVPVPAPDQEHQLKFLLCFDGLEFQAELAFPSHTSRFTKDFSYAYWKFGDYFSYFRKDTIHIIQADKWKTLYKEIRLWAQIWHAKNGSFRKQLPLKMLNFVLRPYFAKQKIWLFFDKIYKGGDSSEYIYKYAVKQQDGIRKYYLLDKKAADYRRLKKEGYRPLVRGSLKHRLVFLNANMVIASNSTVFAFNDYNFKRSLVIRGDVHFDVACVQHGMSIQKIALAQQRLRDNTKLYFCASKYEIENLSKPVYDYVGYDALKLTGVPRYDGLKDRRQKILLFSPTWRMNSARPVTQNEGVARDYNPNFKETSYFQVYNSLINDPRLLAAARQHGYRIQYVLHPIVSPQYEDFTQNDLVELIPSTGDMSYEKIFCEAALMVTDFSGVQFDFAYMRKPVVYLHHNDIPQHYENGTFYYDTMGFGEICHTNSELIDVLCQYMEQDCIMPELYRKRADDFFAFSDHNNCERIYPIMLEHERSREN